MRENEKETGVKQYNIMGLCEAPLVWCGLKRIMIAAGDHVFY